MKKSSVFSTISERKCFVVLTSREYGNKSNGQRTNKLRIHAYLKLLLMQSDNKNSLNINNLTLEVKRCKKEISDHIRTISFDEQSHYSHNNFRLPYNSMYKILLQQYQQLQQQQQLIIIILIILCVIIAEMHAATIRRQSRKPDIELDADINEPNINLLRHSAWENNNTIPTPTMIFNIMLNAIQQVPSSAGGVATLHDLNMKIYGDGVEHKLPPVLERIIQRIQTYFSVYRYTDTTKPVHLMFWPYKETIISTSTAIATTTTTTTMTIKPIKATKNTTTKSPLTSSQSQAQSTTTTSTPNQLQSVTKTENVNNTKFCK
ncbi:uncharacterized protein ACN2A1_003837 [Glossina fuscipes fuscipes]